MPEPLRAPGGPPRPGHGEGAWGPRLLRALGAGLWEQWVYGLCPPGYCPGTCSRILSLSSRGPGSEQSWPWVGGAPGRTAGTYW